VKKSMSSTRTTLRRRRTYSTDGGRMSAGSAVGGGSERRVQPDPLPPNGLGQGPVEHDVDQVLGAGAQRPIVTTAAAEKMRVDVVDVGGGQLGDRDVPEVREEMAAHQAAGLAHRRR
jgi:hypothetical protein